MTIAPRRLMEGMADNYPKAAGKHAVDSRALLTAKRFDGAGYLAGYAVECVLKALIQVERGVPALSHNIGALGAEAARLASTPSQRTAKYVTRPSVTTLAYGLPTGWSEQIRYLAPGVVSEQSAADWVAEAERLYQEVIIPMKLDNVLP